MMTMMISMILTKNVSMSNEYKMWVAKYQVRKIFLKSRKLSWNKKRHGEQIHVIHEDKINTSIRKLNEIKWIRYR